MDQYAKEQARQNAGGVCSACGAAQGHFLFCPLICRETAEAHSAAQGKLSTEDSIRAAGLGIEWN